MNSQLDSLLNDGLSCVYLKKCKKHIALNPSALININGALRVHLNKLITKFDPEIDGIVMGFQNVRTVNRLQTIVDDTPLIYISLEAEFYVFRPEVGKSLSGTVKKKRNDFIGCLVHEKFNVSIPVGAEDKKKNSNYKEICPGQQITFTVELVDFSNSLPYIVGKLDSVGSIQSSVPPESTTNMENITLSKKAKKRKKQDSLSSVNKSVEEENSLVNLSDPINSTVNDSDNIKKEATPSKIATLKTPISILKKNTGTESTPRKRLSWFGGNPTSLFSVDTDGFINSEVSPKKKKRKKDNKDSGVTSNESEELIEDKGPNEPEEVQTLNGKPKILELLIGDNFGRQKKVKKKKEKISSHENQTNYNLDGDVAIDKKEKLCKKARRDIDLSFEDQSKKKKKINKSELKSIPLIIKQNSIHKMEENESIHYHTDLDNSELNSLKNENINVQHTTNVNTSVGVSTAKRRKKNQTECHEGTEVHPHNIIEEVVKKKRKISEEGEKTHSKDAKNKFLKPGMENMQLVESSSKTIPFANSTIISDTSHPSKRKSKLSLSNDSFASLSPIKNSDNETETYEEDGFVTSTQTEFDSNVSEKLKKRSPKQSAVKKNNVERLALELSDKNTELSNSPKLFDHSDSYDTSSSEKHTQSSKKSNKIISKKTKKKTTEKEDDLAKDPSLKKPTHNIRNKEKNKLSRTEKEAEKLSQIDLVSLTAELLKNL